MKIIISIGQDGRFDVDVDDGVPMLTALGALEVAKNMLINNGLISKGNSKSEVITDKE